MHQRTLPALALVAGIALAGTVRPALAQSDEGLARQLANPLSTLTRLPLLLDWDRKIGTARDGDRFSLRALPVLPIDLNDSYNLVSRTDAALVAQSDVAPGAGSQFGFGDVTETLLLSPKSAGGNGTTWGAGAAMLFPTGTDSRLSGRKWGLGPAGAFVGEADRWTYGVLANHIWSVAGESSRRDISRTSLQPFVNYTTRDAWTFGLEAESSFDWESKQGTLPVALTATKITAIGNHRFAVGGGLRHYLDAPESGPHGWAFRLGFTLMFQ